MVGQGDLSEGHLAKETSELITSLKEIKDRLDAVRSNVLALTQKVELNQLPTTEGMSYLETKHLLLLNYCQSIVYYVLRKAKGMSIEKHPVVRSLVENRLFLEKIRPIDKKLDYQVQKLIRAAADLTVQTIHSHEVQKGEESGEEDPLRYRSNHDMLVNKTSLVQQNGCGVYRPPKFAPTSMDDDKISKQEMQAIRSDKELLKQEKQAIRRDKELLRRTKQSSYMKEFMDDFEDRPEEVRQIVGSESKELSRYIARREEQSRQEEELFTRAPVTKREKKAEKYMKKSNGLLSLTDEIFNDFGTFPLEEKEKGGSPSKDSGGARKRFKRQKRH
ncbi:hypothetical protein KSP40_PGU012357 [Platanthera guangdongensis]|uniref:Neuroguidin n=1 Tax=Platanthera guangdongensis TaxID=2320717 RepID=A0ABR2MX36_9ASPA